MRTPWIISKTKTKITKLIDSEQTCYRGTMVAGMPHALHDHDHACMHVVADGPHNGYNVLSGSQPHVPQNKSQRTVLTKLASRELQVTIGRCWKAGFAK